MKRRTVNILLAVGGVGALVIVGLIAFGAYMAMSLMRSEAIDAGAADRAFADVRQRFGGAEPVFALRGGELTTRRAPPAAAPSPVTTVHILHYRREDQQMTRADLPFALLRLSDDPIEFSDDTGQTIGLRVEDIERYGSALLLEHEDDDGPIIIWTD